MDDELRVIKWAGQMRDTMQTFRLKVFLRDAEGEVPLSCVPHEAIRGFREILSQVSVWDDAVFGGSFLMYGCFFSAGISVELAWIEVRLIGECKLSDRNRLLTDLTKADLRYTTQGYSVARIEPWKEWGGVEFIYTPIDEPELVHELWTGDGPFAVEHVFEAELYGGTRRFRARALWEKDHFTWKDRQFTYVFADVPSWVEAHVDKIRDLLAPDLTVVSSRVFRKDY